MESINIKTENLGHGIPMNSIPLGDVPGSFVNGSVGGSGSERPMTHQFGSAYDNGNTGHAAHGGHIGMESTWQDYLSPFFQPFGVDASHLPLTNPPIFQSSLANCSDGPRRRRISISNGQISQLGDETGSVEDLYYSQPPPMPLRHEPMKSMPRTMVKYQKDTPVSNITVPPHSNAPYVTPSSSTAVNDGVGAIDSVVNHALPTPLSTFSDAVTKKGDSLEGDGLVGVPPVQPPQYGLPFESYQGEMNQQARFYRPYHQDPLPGTSAWKRARLLERNRIAASKCRQRKKVAQQQLQKDVHDLSRVNRDLKRKIDYYEKLVSKFKKFTEIHMATCGGSKEQLNMIEEMLKIDHNITETGMKPLAGPNQNFHGLN
ncbi:LAMI_0G12684g1_1 [Lachancea mirantina]|uniref:LAMI_0G12684g1_1 n=1 Tax=Lachancea mirantina TaxID=1230905 RepID=A0A1G4KBI8_9SACH|nr:LAMI_0G12684g1_1 [Lachancea mirantina]